MYFSNERTIFSTSLSTLQSISFFFKFDKAFTAPLSEKSQFTTDYKGLLVKGEGVTETETQRKSNYRGKGDPHGRVLPY